MRCAVWFSFFGMPESGFNLPYYAHSPTLYKLVEYDDAEIRNEIDRILAEPGTQKFGVGQSLYYQLPLFANPNNVIPEWCWQILEDYHLCKNFNANIGNLDDISAQRADLFLIIDNEIQNCIEHGRKLDGRSKSKH